MISPMIRIGIGYDVHRFEAGRPLVLGGVRIPNERGLMGHSDGDALLHAVTDALLGAAGLKDIGHQFPDTDQRYKGADSARLLGEVRAMVETEGYRVVNVDTIVIVEQPRLAKHVDRIRARIAEILGVSVGAVAVKGKTNEGFGYIGEGEGLAAWAAVLIERID